MVVCGDVRWFAVVCGGLRWFVVLVIPALAAAYQYHQNMFGCETSHWFFFTNIAATANTDIGLWSHNIALNRKVNAEWCFVDHC